MAKFAPGTFDLRVKRGMSGRGLFAYSPIKKGACIAQYFGRTLTEKEEYTSRSLYLFEASKTKTIDGNVKGNIAKYKPLLQAQLRSRNLQKPRLHYGQKKYKSGRRASLRLRQRLLGLSY